MKRVIVFGPPKAGKSTLLRRLAQAAGAEVEREKHRERWVLRGRTKQNVELSTLPGSVRDIDDWRSLTEDAGAAAYRTSVSLPIVVLALDAYKSREEANRDHVAALPLLFPNTERICVVRTKCDLIDYGLEAATLDPPPGTRLFETRRVFDDATVTGVTELATWLFEGA